MDPLPSNHVSYYDILQVTPKSTSQEIKQSYHRILLSLHPDKSQSQSHVVQTSSNVDLSKYLKAYRVLTTSRDEYDLQLQQHHVNQGLADGSGLDHIDLSSFNETFENGEYIWVKKCIRCQMGQHVVKETQLEEVPLSDNDKGMGEVAVQCDNCSLWISVGFKLH